jgi:hypothetical protein
MLNLFKKIVIWITLLVNITVWSTPVAYAGLKDTLTQLGASVSSQSSGRYSSSARNVQTMGGMSMRFATRGSSVTFISIQPPGYSVGCGGISAWFGGFSFVTGKQVEQWIRTIAQGATAFVVKMAIKALCPICEAVLATIEKLAQFAAKLSMDGCAAGQALAAMAVDSFSDKTKDKTRSVCGKEVTKSGQAADILEAMDSFCNSVSDADKKLTKAKEKLFNKDDPAGELTYEQGNQTWLVLRGMNLAGPEAAPDPTTGVSVRGWHGYLLLNMIGANTQGDGDTVAACVAAGGTQGTQTDTVGTSNPKESGCTYLPKASASSIWGALMCGNTDKTKMPTSLADQSATGSMLTNVEKTVGDKKVVDTEVVSVGSAVFKSLSEYCQGLSGNTVTSTGSLWVCDGKDEPDVDNKDFPRKCINMREENWSDVRARLLGSESDDGYLLYVYTLLFQGVNSVVKGEALKPELIALLDRTPYPVYQLLTVAAVYPDAALTSIGSLSLLIGQSMVTDEIRRLSTSLAQTGALRTTSGAQVSMRISDAIKNINEHNVNVTRAINTEADLQTKMYTQIRDMNRRIQQSVLGPNLLANEKLAATLSSRVRNRDAATSSPSTAASASSSLTAVTP